MNVKTNMEHHQNYKPFLTQPFIFGLQSLDHKTEPLYHSKLDLNSLLIRCIGRWWFVIGTYNKYGNERCQITQLDGRTDVVMIFLFIFPTVWHDGYKLYELTLTCLFIFDILWFIILMCENISGESFSRTILVFEFGSVEVRSIVATCIPTSYLD